MWTKYEEFRLKKFYPQIGESIQSGRFVYQVIGTSGFIFGSVILQLWRYVDSVPAVELKISDSTKESNWKVQVTGNTIL